MKFIGKVRTRMSLVILAILIQIGWIIFLINQLGRYYMPITVGLTVISVIVVVVILNRQEDPAVKLAWIVPILIFPLFGGITYLFLGHEYRTRAMRAAMRKGQKLLDIKAPGDKSRIREITRENPAAGGQFRYLENQGFPVYKDTTAAYFPTGEAGFSAILAELKKAEHFIFMEYFIIGRGEMWDAILEILREKIRQGVDVRVVYDDFGSISEVPLNYDKKLQKMGIKCLAFNPFIPYVSTIMNNRDHRKILVIDGHTAFTGGINLADEYINKKTRFGYWKDCAVMIRGEAVWTMTLMFLRMWNIFRPTDRDVQIFRPGYLRPQIFEGDGYVQPYGDSPLNKEPVAENVYLNLISNAKEYVYIFTPYLIPDETIIKALCLAAQRGVDIKIITPGIPDKKIIFQMTQSHFPRLMESGVKIYSYAPGFLHSKCVVCDDEFAVVGTVNMDYRSFSHHFENGCLFYKNSVIRQVKADFEETLLQCSPAKPKEWRSNGVRDVYYAILRLFAPLM